MIDQKKIYSRHELSIFLKEKGIYLTRQRGQNFLLDPNIHSKLIQSTNLSDRDIVIEIGGGLGHLSHFIAQTGAKLIIFEVDKKLAQILKEIFGDRKNITIIWQDFLKADLQELCKGFQQKIKILGNIPYSITTPILEKCFQIKDKIHTMTFTVQKELAQRIVADENSRDYGSLSAYCQAVSKPKFLFTVARNVFFPVPKVDSAVVHFQMESGIPLEIKDSLHFSNLLKSIFCSRRKKITTALKKSPFLSLTEDMILRAIDECKISPNIRGEILSPYFLAQLSNSLYKLDIDSKPRDRNSLNGKKNEKT